MDDRRSYLAALLLPLTICGLVLLMVSTSRLIRAEQKWPFRVASMLLLAPGLIHMLLTSPLWEEDIKRADDGREGENSPQPRPGALAPTVALPSPAGRHASLVYEHHPDLGDYLYSPTTASWTQRRAMGDGQPLLLSGCGRSPSAEQIALWREIDARLGELTAVAVRVVDLPPVRARRILLSRTPAFSRAELALREVRLGQGAAFELFFDTPLGDKIHLWPMVTFADGRVTASEWVP